ncbi:hypothetical protein ONE63_005822 [Megalurothrips usitatus]|uniref:Secreted protein n=1 Tax=Megalurothrips usitatus TaxID=439358 RepID=A0AAV7XZ96_9NEOP|nr:hypothetical protein ONE63_005822 [Megalurothrips usitatus]
MPTLHPSPFSPTFLAFLFFFFFFLSSVFSSLSSSELSSVVNDFFILPDVSLFADESPAGFPMFLSPIALPSFTSSSDSELFVRRKIFFAWGLHGSTFKSFRNSIFFFILFLSSKSEASPSE